MRVGRGFRGRVEVDQEDGSFECLEELERTRRERSVDVRREEREV